jgi:hypothetical protein
MSTPDHSRQAELRAQLSSTLASLNTPSPLAEFDFLVSPGEVNERHGTAIVLKYIFSSGTGIISIRSRDLYDGRQHFGDRAVRISTTPDRSQVAAPSKLYAFGRPVLSVPYFRDECCQPSTNLPGASRYVSDGRPEHLCLGHLMMKRELLEVSNQVRHLRELCDVYEEKYGLPFYLLPPVVPGG